MRKGATLYVMSVALAMLLQLCPLPTVCAGHRGQGPLLSQPILEHLWEADNGWDPGGSGLSVKPPSETMSHGRDGMRVWSKVWFFRSLPSQCTTRAASNGSQQLQELGRPRALRLRWKLQTPSDPLHLSL